MIKCDMNLILFQIFFHSGGKLVDPSPDLERELKADLDKALKQFGGGPGVDMSKFPSIEFPEVKIDPINLETAK